MLHLLIFVQGFLDNLPNGHTQSVHAGRPDAPLLVFPFPLFCHLYLLLLQLLFQILELARTLPKQPLCLGAGNLQGQLLLVDRHDSCQIHIEAHVPAK